MILMLFPQPLQKNTRYSIKLLILATKTLDIVLTLSVHIYHFLTYMTMGIVRTHQFITNKWEKKYAFFYIWGYILNLKQIFPFIPDSQLLFYPTILFLSPTEYFFYPTHFFSKNPISKIYPTLFVDTFIKPLSIFDNNFLQTLKSLQTLFIKPKSSNTKLVSSFIIASKTELLNSFILPHFVDLFHFVP